MPKSKVQHPGAWRRLYSQNSGLEIGEVRRCNATTKSVTGRNQSVASEQLSKFAVNDMPSYMRKGYDRVRRTAKTEHLMDCREVRKFGGTHGKMDRPVARKIVPEINITMALSYLNMGGAMLHDPEKQCRVIEYNGRIVGCITNATMQSIMSGIPLQESRVQGTHQIAYKAVNEHA